MLSSMGNVMREAYKRGWITTKDGNISIRDGDDFCITPSGVDKTLIRCDDILSGKWNHDLDSVDFYDTVTKPSGELTMHLRLQSTHNSYKSVVHLHPTNTIAAIFKGWDLQYLADQFPELSRYTKVAKTVSAHPVCSPELARETHVKMINRYGQLCFDIVGQAQHGVAAIGEDPWDAFEHIERLEHICTIALNSGVHPND